MNEISITKNCLENQYFLNKYNCSFTESILRVNSKKVNKISLGDVDGITIIVDQIKEGSEIVVGNKCQIDTKDNKNIKIKIRDSTTLKCDSFCEIYAYKNSTVYCNHYNEITASYLNKIVCEDNNKIKVKNKNEIQMNDNNDIFCAHENYVNGKNNNNIKIISNNNIVVIKNNFIDALSCNKINTETGIISVSCENTINTEKAKITIEGFHNKIISGDESEIITKAIYKYELQLKEKE